MKQHLMTLAFVLGASLPALSQQASHPSAQPGTAQPYAGHQTRGVTSLSADEMQGFLEGRGMGLAKPAELNGYPGPMHVLELDKELMLSEDQRARIKASMDNVKTKTRALGARYIAAEKAVDDAFRSNLAAKVIAARVAAANKLLGEIRYAHLAAHIEIGPLLSKEQRAKYAELRGYGAGHNSGAHKH